MSMFRKNTITNTMFVRNVTQFVATSYTATATSGGGGGGGGGGGADSSIYDTLANSAPFKEIQRLSTQFANGSLPTLKNQLTPELYTTLSTTLATLALPNYATYTKIYTQEQTTLMMLSQAVAQYNALLDAQATIQTNEECCAILNDMDRLMAYISGLRRQMSIFPDQEIQVIKAEIKPEYLRYIQLYGVPENLAWDPEKLAYAVSLVESGQ